MAACIVVLLAFIAACSAGPGTTMCYNCDIRDPTQCRNFERCHLHDHRCQTEVVFENGHFIYKMGCKKDDDCAGHGDNEFDIGLSVGRREHHQHGTMVCRQCCTTSLCNGHVCSSYLPTTPTMPTTTMTTTLPSTTPQDPCHDEEDGTFKCSDYDQYYFCVDTAAVAHDIALNHCRKHCGFCKPQGHQAAQVTVVQPTATSSTP